MLGEACGRAASDGTAMNGFERSRIWPRNPEFFQKSGFVPSNLKYCIVSDDENIEKPHERVEDRPTSSTRSSTSERPDRTACKDPVKEAGASSPETGDLKTIGEIFPLRKSHNLQQKKKRTTTSVATLICSTKMPLR
jgi:hypothetical protein